MDINNLAHNMAMSTPTPLTSDKNKHTGTTIALIRYSDGYLLAADRRATLSNDMGQVYYALEVKKIYAYSPRADVTFHIAGTGSAIVIKEAGSRIFGGHFLSFEKQKGTLITDCKTQAQLETYIQDYFSYLIHSRLMNVDTLLEVGMAMFIGVVTTPTLRSAFFTAPPYWVSFLSRNRDFLSRPGGKYNGSLQQSISLGSGSPYFKAVLNAESYEKPHSKRTRDEALTVLRKAYFATLGLDPYSGTSGSTESEKEYVDYIDLPFKVCQTAEILKRLKF